MAERVGVERHGSARPAALVTRGGSPRSQVASAVGRLAFAVVLLLVASGMLVMTRDFGSEARRLPLVAGVPLVLLTAANLVLEARVVLAGRGERERAGASREPGRPRVTGDPPATPDTATEVMTGRAVSLPVAIFGVLGSLVVLYLLLGQMLAALVFTVLAMRLVGRQRWRNVIVATAFLLLVTYLLSDVMGVRVHRGWIPEAFDLPGWS